MPTSVTLAGPWLAFRLMEPSKRNSEYFDPCQEAASRSLRCLRRNGGDREFCSDFFQLVPIISSRAERLVIRPALSLKNLNVDVALDGC